MKIEKGQDVLLTSKDGLEVRLPNEGKFDNVVADGETTHLFTIDDKGLNVVKEKTEVGGNSVAKHTNLSDKAAFGGEVKFDTDGSVIINPYSARYGVGNSVDRTETLTKLDGTKKYFESLGYDVKVEFKPKVEIISPKELIPTQPITKSNKQLKKLENQILEDGKINETLKYVEKDGEKYLVDGHHRQKIAKDNKIESVPVEQVELPYKGFKTEEDLEFSQY